MSGKWVRGGERPKPQAGEIVDVRPYELHGTRYYAVLFRLDADPEQAREARVSFDMIYEIRGRAIGCWWSQCSGSWIGCDWRGVRREYVTSDG